MNDKQGVYAIINRINGKIYYGSAADSFSKRWRRHESTLNNNKHPNSYMQAAWNKYGADNFEFKIILLCDPENCLYYEQLFLDKYWDNCNECYNICKVAGSCFGVKRSAQTKQKMSIARQGKLLSNTTKERIGRAHAGRKYIMKKKNNDLKILKTLFNI